MTVEIPKTLDWVKARANCSIDNMFVLLREVIDSDVKSIQAIQSDSKYSIQEPTAEKIVVGKQTNYSGVVTGDAVVFERLRDGISVKDGRTQKAILVARPFVQPDGQCKLQIDDQPQELWQVSKRALEGLFFSN